VRKYVIKGPRPTLGVKKQGAPSASGNVPDHRERSAPAPEKADRKDGEGAAALAERLKSLENRLLEEVERRRELECVVSGLRGDLDARLGSLVQQAAAGNGPEPRTESGSTPPVAEPPPARLPEPAAAGACELSAALEELALADVLQFVRTTKRSGRLSVHSADLEGFINVLHGEAVYAQAADKEGFQAFCDLLALDTGRVEFVTATMDPEKRNLFRSTLSLMMEALRTLDERDSQMRR